MIVLWAIWPFNSVPTGSRGVVTRFGKIIDIVPEGMVILPPWEKVALFSIRAERADVEDAEGSTSDTQPVKVSMTVRYSISTNSVAEVYEKYSHDGDLSSYVQTATQEIFKAVTAKYTAPDLIGKRALKSADINSALRHQDRAVRRERHQHRHAQLRVLGVVHGRDQRKGDPGATAAGC